ncbi:MAG: ribose-phosphate pyrophosphokinase [Bacteroidetes bacterium]|nr:ribose-phosphate pyrophosphokinase [Bacteroidota bacterium]
MKTINLFESNETVELKKFAGGECHVKFLKEFNDTDKVRINTRLNSSDDIMNLCLAVDALRNMYVGYIEVFIPYIPYARQDRIMVVGEPLSVKVFAGIINSLNLNRVIVFDAHSDVSVALINNCTNITNHAMVRHFLDVLNLRDFVLVSPDLGAYKKVDKLASKLDYKGRIATGIKVRDLSTGQIIKSDVNTDDLKGKACVVVDDICDGGRTFIELGTALKAKDAGELYFIASHGIFSHNALDRLKEAGYKSVCSSNSISNIVETDFYKQYNLF